MDITNDDIADVVRKTGSFPDPGIVSMHKEITELDRILNLNPIDSDLVDPISNPGWNPTSVQRYLKVTLNMNKVVAVQAT